MPHILHMVNASGLFLHFKMLGEILWKNNSIKKS